MIRHKLIILGVAFITVMVLAGVGTARAQTVRSGDSVTVKAGERVDSMLFAAGNNVDIAGEVNGDVYCAGQSVIISGTVQGDVFCVGQNVRIAGKIEGSVRVAGQNVTHGGEVFGSMTVASQSFTAESSSRIGRDLLGGTQTANLDGIISRDVALGAATGYITNQIGRNVKGDIANLTLTSNARVGGVIEYTSANEPTVNEGAQIASGIQRKTPPKAETKPRYAPLAFTFMTILYIFVALLLVILALAVLIPQILHDASTRLMRQPGKVMGIGLLAGLIVPVLIVLLLISIVGIPLALLVILLWCTIGMLSGPFSAYALGRLMLKDSKSPILIALLGGSVLLLLYFVPLIGFFALIGAHIIGTGMIINDAMYRLPKPDQKVRTKLK